MLNRLILVSSTLLLFLTLSASSSSGSVLFTNIGNDGSQFTGSDGWTLAEYSPAKRFSFSGPDAKLDSLGAPVGFLGNQTADITFSLVSDLNNLPNLADVLETFQISAAGPLHLVSVIDTTDLILHANTNYWVIVSSPRVNTDAPGWYTPVSFSSTGFADNLNGGNVYTIQDVEPPFSDGGLIVTGTAVPEPVTLLALGVGLAVLRIAKGRR